MIKSMTGYGKGNLELEEREYQVEIKSVNHRYLDVNIRIPRSISYLEEDVRKLVSSKIKRGKIDIFITFNNNSTEGKEIKINKELAKVYIDQLKELAWDEQIASRIEAVEISRFPDVLQIQNKQDDETIKDELTQAVNIAVNNLVEMRTIEGEKMATDIQERLDKIDEEIQKISKLSTGLIEEYVVKLEDRIKELLKTEDIDKSRLAQEVVIYADKCSIEEEITRLNSHISQLKDLLNEEKAVGKQIDFLIQEMNRETNTIGSKSNNLEITNSVITIKTRNRRYKRTSSKYRIERADNMQLVNIGFGNIVSADRIVAIISPESAPVKRLIQEAKDSKTAVDATYGRRTRAVLIMDSGHVILSAVQPETVAGRVDRDITQEEKEINSTKE